MYIVYKRKLKFIETKKYNLIHNKQILIALDNKDICLASQVVIYLDQRNLRCILFISKYKTRITQRSQHSEFTKLIEFISSINKTTIQKV